MNVFEQKGHGVGAVPPALSCLVFGGHCSCSLCVLAVVPDVRASEGTRLTLLPLCWLPLLEVLEEIWG